MGNDLAGAAPLLHSASSRRRLAGFARHEGGAVGVEYLVMAAAVVGLALGTLTAVRTGVGTLGRDSGDSLTGATVMAAAPGNGGGQGTGGTGGTGGTVGTGGGAGTPDVIYPVGSLGDYTLLHYDPNTLASLQAWVSADFSDSDLSREYAYQVEYFLANGGDNDLTRETVDWIYVMAYELTRRGVGYPTNSMTFDQVLAAYTSMITPTGGVRGPRTAPPRS